MTENATSPGGWPGWEAVCAEARPLSEQLESESGGASLDADEFDEFLDEWAESLGGEVALRDRLALDDFGLADVRERLVGSEIPDERSIPGWAERADRVVARAASLDHGAYDDLLDADRRRPFVHVTAPLVRATSAEVEFPASFSATAVTDLERWLLSRLTTLCRHPLFIQFKAFLGEREIEPSADSTAAYEAFVEAVLDDEFRSVFGTYPVLARYLGTVLGQWLDAVAEFAERLVADRDALAAAFADGAALGRVTDVTVLSDDYHGAGRLVLGPTFESGHTVVYKPRSVSPAAAFGRVLHWVNAETEVPDVYVPSVVERSGYGWMEFVEASSCESESGIERYHERVGGLVALAYLLGGTDLHFENVIAHGEQPVLVDLETMLTPGDPASKHAESEALAPTFHGTVLETLMLPVVERASEEDRTLAGLRKPDVGQTFEHQLVFTDANTDAMDLTFTREADPSGNNLPVLDGESLEPDAHLDALKDGFETVTQTIRRRRNSFVETVEAAFRGCTMRYLHRQTRVYASHLLRNTYSSHLRSGLQTGLQMAELCRPFVDGHVSDPAHWDIVDCERVAIERRDVPRFTIEADERTLRFDGDAVSTVASSPLDRVRHRVESLDPATMETQLALLELPFGPTAITAPASEPASVDGGPVATATSSVDVVSNVVAAIAETVTPRREGGLTWPDVTGPRPANAIVFGEPGLELYDGYVGVGVFLAAVASVRDDESARELAEGVLEPVRSAVESGDELDALGCGGVLGTGSVVYGLCRAGTLLDDADLVASARAASATLDRETVAADDEFGVVDGSAGELLANLTVHEETGAPGALERALWCGEHLLASRVESETGHRVWRSEHFARPLSGFSHGTAGIGYALGRLGDVTGRDEFLDAAREAIAFESALFERDGGWEDRRDDVPARSDAKGSWCHGRPGIGVGRLGVQSDVDGIDCRRGLRRAVESRSTALSFEDSLCCGTAGRACFLREAGELLGESSLTSDSDVLLDAVRSRASEEGWARLKGHTLGVPRPSLFNGLAGIGYAALGAEADPGTLPNVIRLE